MAMGIVRASGDPRALGLALGQAGRAGMAAIRQTALWAEVTGPAHAAAVARMAQAVQVRFPEVWDEVVGLAQGLDLPADQVFAWNCRGDLLAQAPEGCTTVMLPGPAPVLAHNEDGYPFLRGRCFLAEVRPADAPGFIAFCYPGSIPGHTFAATGAGLVQTVNNLRLCGIVPDVPRMVLGRAVLAAEGLDQAVEVLKAGGASGGFHFALAQVGDGRLLSVEFGGGAVSVRALDRPAAHANHALHLTPPRGQIVTRSSADRQARAEALLAQGAGPLEILRDRGGPGLPIRRNDPEDPDEENTLATALVRLEARGIDWQVFDRASGPPAQRGRLEVGR